MRLADAVADHGFDRREGQAPSLLLQRQHGGDFHAENRDHDRASGNTLEKRGMEPGERRPDKAQQENLGEGIERRTVEGAAQPAGPDEGHDGDHAPNHRKRL